MRETQEGCPSPLKSVVFETFSKFQKLSPCVEKTFSTHGKDGPEGPSFFAQWECKGGGSRGRGAVGTEDIPAAPGRMTRGAAQGVLRVATGAEHPRNDVFFWQGMRRNGPMLGANQAPPVADEARRFRGSAPIGGHDGGRESAGTTVGSCRPLRVRGKRYLRCRWGL